MEFLIVFLGGGLGSAMRHGVNVLAARHVASSFPFGTLAINVLGSFVMGLVVELLALRMGLPQNLRLFLTTGILGGFTTFSTFSLEAALLHERGQTALAGGYVAASVVLGVGALFLGMALVRWGR
ncbi:fluoride efflux transporter CrcB [Xenophilus azovorans]|mgnify:CR=1 FL=1|uniref:fluoride efflux transporter CrcB n=1 Tax=Xenophilus azovorans TaxID=151755 RepID=UPI00056E0EE5|nr:fluoride efflux transporter CrcB [Xenophilus azovorans]